MGDSDSIDVRGEVQPPFCIGRAFLTAVSPVGVVAGVR
jgi:hypothetical protein